MKWYLGPIDAHIDDIKKLFEKNIDHKHSDNYTKWPLFNQTVFARLGYSAAGNLIYYSAGIERPEYEGGVRIMSRHTRDRKYNFGSMQDDLARGLETLDTSTEYALELGYSDIWLSREESPQLFNYFSKNSKFSWDVYYGDVKYHKDLKIKQWIMKIKK
jgi:hypothetical protein